MKSLPRSLAAPPPPSRAPEQRVPTAAITTSSPSAPPRAADEHSPAPCRERGAAPREGRSPLGCFYMRKLFQLSCHIGVVKSEEYHGQNHI